ncbi:MULTISPECIES: class I SAM-dependent methyltransferase [Bacillus cereus group]|uniref:class I SAM-dependent methyltransferase n=1 Tax=Bacillus cereus group TaxID=86661 RepID=UPI0021D340AB|nr:MULTISPECIES: class I SAM-dependent methyltransferase [Bacillus cereus group]MCU5424662.1 class I SAM-dependent methyltransferase [Bacillus tropicus]MDA1885747.1 class I SAM-dependent methyltransferase [Bacillus cereus group sp. BY105LC]
MRLKQDASAEKLAGRYYTPYDLADFIVRWGTSDIEINNVLEPSCGDGVFLEALRQVDLAFNCTAVEIFEEEAEIARNRFILDDRFNIVISDFYETYMDLVARNERYQFIMGNPPYIRYQYLTPEQRDIQSNILNMSGMSANKLINAWVAFVVAAINIMDDDSKIGFVIPAELLQVKYSEQLRMYLMRELNEITIITFEELIFEGVEQEVVVLLGRKRADYQGSHVMKILEFNDVQDLVNNFTHKNMVNRFQPIDMNTVKWTKYFLNAEENRTIQEVINGQNCIKFADIAEVDVGITTGNNKFFCVDHETALRYDLLNVSKPLIARSVNIPGVTFDDEDWQRNIEGGARTYLLDFNPIADDQLSEGQREYIRHGESMGENTGYKCRIRQRWYAIPAIWEPEAFFLRRNYHYPKFVLNLNHAVSTDTMHRVVFNLGISPKKAVLSYYNSIGFAFTELEARSYGGGVLEILPRELENVRIPNVFDLVIEDEIVDMLFNFLNETIRQNRNIEEALNLIDDVILIERMGFSRENVQALRNVWHRLKDRRLGRGNNKGI